MHGIEQAAFVMSDALVSFAPLSLLYGDESPVFRNSSSDYVGNQPRFLLLHRLGQCMAVLSMFGSVA